MNRQFMTPEQLVNITQGISNPQEFLQTLLGKNPNIKQVMGQLQNSAFNASPEEMAKQMAKKIGMSEEQLMQMYNNLSHK